MLRKSILGLLLILPALLPLGCASPQQLPTAASSSPTQTVAPSPSPSLSPTPNSTPRTAALSPSPTTTASATPTSPAPPATPALTAEQQAMNQRAVAEFRASMAPIDSQIEMRVAIAEAVPSLTISTSTEASLLDPQRQPLQQIAAEKSYTVAPSGSSIQFGDWELPDIVWVEPPPGGLVRVGDRTYRGALLVVLDSGKLWAVNLVSLRQYLHSVVGSEVSPSWPPDALKAQAVAARSYALTYFFRPFSPLFHLGATEYYQVYKGIESEAESTKQAVDQTGGQFVSRRGDVVESLYAASDDIVAEAFQGHGMSQLGALDLSEQGYTYKEILKKYYPGTGVGRIANEIE